MKKLSFLKNVSDFTISGHWSYTKIAKNLENFKEVTDLGGAIFKKSYFVLYSLNLIELSSKTSMLCLSDSV